MGASTGSKQASPRWLMLFGLPFAAVGVGVLGWLVLPALLDWYAMKSWVPVQAEVLSAELEVHRGDSTTYSVNARYRYEYAANTWENDRVAIMDGSDNFGDFHQALAAQLEAARDAGRPVTVYVDPRAPANAVIVRDLRGGQVTLLSLFGLLFAAVGIGLIAFGFWSGRRREQVEPVEDGQRPWLARRAWAQPVVRSGGRAGAVVAWVFALFWCGISGAATLAAWDDIAGGDRGALFILLFDGIGVALLVWAVHATLSARRFGELTLMLDPHPGAIGGDVGGYVDLPLPFDATRAIEVTLSCVRVYTRRSGNKSETRREPVYSDTRHFLGEPAPDGGTRLHFCFAVPGGLPVSSPPSSEYHAWAIDLACALPGVDLARRFDIPVFATGSKMALAARVRESQEAALARLETHMNLAQVPGGITLDFRAGRDVRGALLMGLFGAVFAAVPVFLLTSGKASGFPEVLIVGVFALVGSGLFAAGVWTLGNALQVRLDDGGADVRRFLFGVPVQARQVPRANITGLAAVRAGSMTSGNKVTVYYRLALRQSAGKDVVIGDGFRGFGEAQRAAEAIGTFTRLPFLGEGRTPTPTP